MCTEIRILGKRSAPRHVRRSITVQYEIDDVVIHPLARKKKGKLEMFGLGALRTRPTGWLSCKHSADLPKVDLRDETANLMNRCLCMLPCKQTCS
jgi:hypothetical protein